MSRLNLCLLTEKEVAPYAKSVKPFPGGVQVEVSDLEAFRKRFAPFIYEEATLAEAVHHAFIAAGKKLALAESCTGGALAARLVAIPDASRYFLGSIVAYSNAWKERLLQVSHSTLIQEGAVSKAVVVEMVRGLFAETDADFAVAISGLVGPSGGTAQKPVGTIYIAVGERGKSIDAGKIVAKGERPDGIELAAQTALGVLWRRLVHHTFTLS